MRKLFLIIGFIVLFSGIVLGNNTYYPGAAKSAFHIGSNSYDFLNVSSEYATAPDDNVFTLSSGFSVCAWVEFDSATRFGIVLKDDNGSNREWGFYTTAGNRLGCAIRDNSASGYLYSDTLNYLMTQFEGEWHYYCCTWDGTTADASGIELFVDCGIDRANNDSYSNFTDMDNTDAIIWIGRFQTFYSNGRIKNVSIWDAVITRNICQNARLNSYSTMSSITKADLIVHYDMDVDLNDDVGVECGGGCNGTAQNGLDVSSPADYPILLE